jgi:hypothetical protein
MKNLTVDQFIEKAEELYPDLYNFESTAKKLGFETPEGESLQNLKRLFTMLVVLHVESEKVLMSKEQAKAK